MKPIYIKMSAFGSYAGEEVVDFTNVNHGIFLITGDTGAGKTTIFDAITYALYDETSGGKRNGEMMRSQFAQEDTRTFVELKFIYNGETYTIIRYPRQSRISKKKNKDGEYTTTIDQPTVELILPDGLPYKGKIKETNQKIIDIVGLDVNQFTQIAMIAQGDFLKLLHAPSKERKEIFAKIFNTRIYWRIEEELKARAKVMYGKLEDNRKDIIREMEDVRCVEGSAYSVQWEESPRFLESDTDKLLELVKQIIEEADTKEKEVNEALKSNQDELDRILSLIRLATDTNKMFTLLENAENRKIELESREEEMATVTARIEGAKRASLIEAKEVAYTTKQKEMTECKQRIVEHKAWVENQKVELESYKKSKEQTETEYKKHNPELSSKINKINELIPKYEQLEDVIEARDLLRQKKDNEKAKLDKLIDRINLAKERQERIHLEQVSLKDISEQSVIFAQAVEKLSERKKSLEGLIQSLKLLKSLWAVYENTQKEYNRCVSQQEEKNSHYNALYHQFIEGQASILAATLKEGEPCPVCGSSSHPHRAVSSGVSISQVELEEAKKAVELANKALQNKYDDLQKAKQKYETEKSLAQNEGKKIVDETFQIESITDTELQSMLQDCQELLLDKVNKKKEAEKAKEKYLENEEEIKLLTDTLKACDVEKENVQKSVQELEVNLATRNSEIKALKEALIYENRETAAAELSAAGEQLQKLESAMTNTANQYQTLFNKITEMQGILTAEENSFLRISDELTNAKELYLSEVVRLKFASVEEYQSAKLPSSKIEELSKYHQLYRESVIENETNLKTYAEQTKGKVKVQTDELEEKKTALEAVKSKLNEESKSIYGVRSRNEIIYGKVVKLLQSRKAAKDEFAIISRLDATANGKLSQRHMNFQTYIQRRYFNLILHEANKRLYTMSNAQFILKCRDVLELSGQGEVGLELDVYSMVNDQTRDVKTLSGGESFMASLAMALGMADIIQNTAGNIHIDTMFIDEGFGSLSDETRRQAIKILNELSEGKRLVGIISHVTELKTQIGTKLIVTKGEKGSKTKWEIGE